MSRENLPCVAPLLTLDDTASMEPGSMSRENFVASRHAKR